MPRAVILTLAAVAWLALPAAATDPPQPKPSGYGLADLVRLVPSADRALDLFQSARVSVRLMLPDAPWVRYLGFADRVVGELALGFDDKPVSDPAWPERYHREA